MREHRREGARSSGGQRRTLRRDRFAARLRAAPRSTTGTVARSSIRWTITAGRRPPWAPGPALGVAARRARCHSLGGGAASTRRRMYALTRSDRGSGGVIMRAWLSGESALCLRRAARQSVFSQFLGFFRLG